MECEAEVLAACERDDYLRAVLLAATSYAECEDADDEHSLEAIRFHAVVLAHESRAQRRQIELPSWSMDPERVRQLPRTWAQFIFLAALRRCSDSSFLCHMLEAAEDDYIAHFGELSEVAQWLREAWDAAKYPGLWEQVRKVQVDPAGAWRLSIQKFCAEYESSLLTRAKGSYARRQKRFMCDSPEFRSLYAMLSKKNSHPDIAKDVEQLKRVRNYLQQTAESLVNQWIVSTRRVKTVSLTDYQRTEVEEATAQVLVLAKDALQAAIDWGRHTVATVSHVDVDRIRGKLSGLREPAIASAATRPWRHLFQEIVGLSCPNHTF